MYPGGGRISARRQGAALDAPSPPSCSNRWVVAATTSPGFGWIGRPTPGPSGAGDGEWSQGGPRPTSRGSDSPRRRRRNWRASHRGDLAGLAPEETERLGRRLSSANQLPAAKSQARRRPVSALMRGDRLRSRPSPSPPPRVEGSVVDPRPKALSASASVARSVEASLDEGVGRSGTRSRRRPPLTGFGRGRPGPRR